MSEQNSSAKNITDKELLTFSNLTNLDWQFVSLKKSEKKVNGKTVEKYPTIMSLLYPEMFYRTNAKNEFERYVYMDKKVKKDEVEKEQYEKGYSRMCQKAGLAMNYKEQLHGEGSFLKEWEVVYAADNYKIATDYLKSSYDSQVKLLDMVIEKCKNQTTKELDDIFLLSIRYILKQMVEEGNSNLTIEEINSITLSEEFKGLLEEEKLFTRLQDVDIKEINAMKTSLNNRLTDMVSRDMVDEKKKTKEIIEFTWNLASFTLGAVSTAKGFKGKKEEYRAEKIKMADNSQKITLENETIKNLKEKMQKRKIRKIIKINRMINNREGKIAELENENKELDKKIDKVLAKFFELVQGNIYNDAVSEVGEGISNQLLAIGMALFTRANAVDFIKKILEEAKDYSLNKLDKLLYAMPNELEGAILGLTEELKYYDTGFRAVAFKRGNEIVLSFKGDEDEEKSKKELLPLGLDRVKLVYNKIKKDYPNEHITLTGFGRGAELAFVNNIKENNKDSSLLFLTNPNEIQGALTFSLEDVDKKYTSNYRFYVKNSAGEIVTYATQAGLGYLLLNYTGSLLVKEAVKEAVKGALSPKILSHIRPLVRFGSKSITSFWCWTGGAIYRVSATVLSRMGASAIIASATTAILVALAVIIVFEGYELWKRYLKNKEAESLLQYIKNEKIIELTQDNSGLYVVSKNYIKDEGVRCPNNKLRNIKVDLGTALFFHLKKDENLKIISDTESKYGTKYRINAEKDEFYIVRKEVEPGMATNFKTYYLSLVPNENNVYRLGRYLLAERIISVRGYQYADKIEENEIIITGTIKKDAKDLEKVGSLSSIIDVHKDINYNYNEMLDSDIEQKFYYFNGTEIEYATDIYEFSSKDNYDNSEFYRNEHAFLPYIDKDSGMISSEMKEDYGVISTEIRKDYKYAIFKYALLEAYSKFNLMGYQYDYLCEKININFGRVDIELEMKNKVLEANKHFGMNFHYLSKLIEGKDEVFLEENIQKIYKIKRTNLDEGYITFKSFGNSNMKYKYNPLINSSFLSESFMINAKRLPNYKKKDILGTNGLIVKEQRELKKHIREIDSNNENESEDENVLGSITIENTLLGENIQLLKPEDENFWSTGIDNIKDFFNLISDEEKKSEFHQNSLKTHYKDLEQYFEVLNIERKNRNNENEIRVINTRYFYSPSNSLIHIQYGEEEVYKHVQIVRNFQNKDYSIDLPRYHKLKGSLKADIEDAKQYEFEINTETIINDSEKSNSNGSAITLDFNGNKFELGSEIEKLEVIESDSHEMYKYQEKLGSHTVYYEYNLLESKVFIYYGELFDVSDYVYTDEENEKTENSFVYEHRFGNAVEITDFVNHNLGLDLAIDYPILYGSIYERENTEKAEYAFTNGFPMNYYVKSNGEGTIVCNDKNLNSLDFINLYKFEDVENSQFDNIVDLAEDKSSSRKYNENFCFKTKDEKYFGVYNDSLKIFSVYYKSQAEDKTDVKLYKTRDEFDLFNLDGYKKLEIRNFKSGDYGINIPLKMSTILGSLSKKTIYSVKKGDTLWKISERELGDGNKWRELCYDDGKSVTTKNPNLIYVGQKILLPLDAKQGAI